MTEQDLRDRVQRPGEAWAPVDPNENVKGQAKALGRRKVRVEIRVKLVCEANGKMPVQDTDVATFVNKNVIKTSGGDDYARIR